MESLHNKFIDIEEKEDILEIKILNKNVTELKVFQKINSFVQEKMKLASFLVSNKKEYIYSPAYGQLVKLNVDKNETYSSIIIQKCLHEATYYNSCINCGMNMKS